MCPVVEIGSKQFTISPYLTVGQLPNDRTLALKNVDKKESICVIEKILVMILPMLSADRILALKFSRSQKHCGVFLILVDDTYQAEELLMVFECSSKPQGIASTILERFNTNWNYLTGKPMAGEIINNHADEIAEILGRHDAMMENLTITIRKLYEKLLDMGEEGVKMDDRVLHIEKFLYNKTKEKVNETTETKPMEVEKPGGNEKQDRPQVDKTK